MQTISNQSPTAELQALDAAHHFHPFTDHDGLTAKGARVITRAEGVWLTDSEGERILDGMAGLWCVALGYGRAEMAEVAATQMRQLAFYNTFFQTTHVPAIAAAARIAELAPGDLNKVFFAGSGSEANDTNIRAVRHYWALMGKPEKSIIIARKNGYHGSTMGGASLGGMSAIHSQGGLPIPDIVHIGQPFWWGEGGDMDPDEFGRMRARELEAKIAELGEGRVAAFIAEPIQGAGGVIIPPESYWPEIQRICDAHEILLIADEVITGFGRTGQWFASQAMGIRPDIITFAKGVTSGYLPMGGSILSDRVASVLSREEFFHGYTFSGHPVCCAVAVENMRIIEEEKVLEHVRDVAAPHLSAKWAALAEHPMVADARSYGMVAGLQLTPDKSARAKFAADEGTIGFMCRERCFANGLVMRHVGDRMIISPPLVITPAEIDTLAERAWTAIDETWQAAKAEGLFKPA